MNAYLKLKKIFTRLSDLQYIQRILMWDEAVMMPEGAGKSRANALATFNRMTQKMLMNKKIPSLIDAAKQAENISPWDKMNLVHMEKEYIRANCIPLQLTENATKAAMMCEQMWRKLRAKNDWQAFAPYLEQSFQCVKEIANRQGQALHLKPYDALLDQYVYGFNQAMIDPIFSELKTILPPLLQKIVLKQAKAQPNKPLGPFPIEKQRLLGTTLMTILGFDFQHGRLDVSHHPFCSGGPDDVRITTRYTQDEFLTSLTAICHETGHALYEQGLPKEWINQPVGKVDSMAMHESQSLLLEMEVCRSLPFYEFISPLLRTEFGEQQAFNANNLYQLATQVQPGLIRVDADEVSYPLHVILRYELEKALFNDEIEIKDLPHHWNKYMTNYLNQTTLGNDKDGVMQDVHWPSGIFGYFPAYTLGRLIAAQLFSTYLDQTKVHDDKIKTGDFAPLRNWLKENVYDYASSLPTQDLLSKVTGKTLDTRYFLDRLQQRY